MLGHAFSPDRQALSDGSMASPATATSSAKDTTSTENAAHSCVVVHVTQ